MRLTPDVALVGSGGLGFDLSSPMDAHIYLLDGGDELVLVDCGVGGTVGNTDLIIENIIADGYDPSRISKLLLTHYHFDHMGAAAEIRDNLGVTVHASPLTARTLANADEEAISLPAAKNAGYLPDDYRLQPCPTAADLVEGHSFAIGHLTVTVYETPGHCEGHLSFLIEGGERRLLVQGDVIFAGGTIFLQNIPDCSIQRYAESARKLDQLEFDAFLPGHSSISLRNGKRHVSAAASQFAKLGVPRNFA